MRIAATGLRVLLDAMGKTPPTEFRILPFGKVETSKGPLVFDQEAAAEVMKAYKTAGNELAVDYEHQTFAEPVAAAPAAGWFDLEVRDDGLYAVNVRWTPKADAHLREGEYRYFSPAVDLDPKTRRVKQLLNVALTNLPATRGMTPLVAAKDAPSGAQEQTMKILLSKLGLAESASEAEALNELAKRETRAADEARELITLTGAKDRSEAMGKLAAWKQSAEQLTTLSAKLAEIEQAQRKTEVESLLADGKREGKIAPAQESYFREMGQKDPAMLKGFLATAVKLVATTGIQEPGKGTKAGDSVELTDIERQMAEKMGNDPEKVAKFKADQAKRKPATA